jgi:hypothetical protein
MAYWQGAGVGLLPRFFTTLVMASLDTAIANIALPAIAAELHVGPARCHLGGECLSDCYGGNAAAARSAKRLGQMT